MNPAEIFFKVSSAHGGEQMGDLLLPAHFSDLDPTVQFKIVGYH